MAIEIVDFPIKNGGSFHGKMLVHQRVAIINHGELCNVREDVCFSYCNMVVDRIMEMEKRFVMGQQTTAARRGPIFP